MGAARSVYLEDKFSEWLYGDYDETKYTVFSTLYSIPGVHDYIDYLLDRRADKEYFERYGMGYSDIHDPRKLKQTRSFGRYLNFVSDNVGSLYTSSLHSKKKKR